MTECDAFLADWDADPLQVKPVFKQFRAFLESCDGADLSFKARPGVTYSFRGAVPEHARELFVMVDVVDDDPAERWLSVCFFDDMVQDPDELGDWVPEGLMGENARCFDVSESDPKLAEYVRSRIEEAWKVASA